MKIGVVIPAYNAQNYLAAALEGVRGQTHPAVDVVVVDDGSTDRTPEIASGFGGGVRCVRQPNGGVSKARNRGAAELRTDWIAFLDADDVWLPDKLERQVRALRPGQRAVLTGIRTVDAELKSIRVPETDRTPETPIRLDLESILFHREGIPKATPSTLLIRNDLFEELGGYDEGLANMADWDLLLRLRLREEVAWVPDPLVLYRRHATNMSRSVRMLERESVRVLDKAFASVALPEDLRRLRRRCLAYNDSVLAGSCFWSGNLGRAAGYGLRALARDPSLTGRFVGFPIRHLLRVVRGNPRPGTV